jgi:hypothetical protein
MNAASCRARSLLCNAIAFLAVAPAAWAQPAPAASATSAPKAALAASTPTQRAPAVPTKAWNELSVAEQKALKPLAANWNSIDAAQRRKWLAVSKNFNTMAPAEQAKLHSRMSEWSALSPKERTQARLNFAETTKVPPDEKLAKWEAYQALTPEEKNRLAASATPRPPGAATAVKPVPAQKLATPVDAKPPRSGASGAASSPKQVDKNTLLPRKHASAP